MTSCQSGFQEFYHNCSPLLTSQKSAFSSNSPLVYLVAGAKNFFCIAGCQQRMVDGQKGTAIRPAKCQQTEALFASHGNMVEDPGGQFSTFYASTLIQRIVNNKAVIAILRCKRANMRIDDPRGQHCKHGGCPTSGKSANG